MGPTILLDKSALESFSPKEIQTLVRHYTVVIPPVLVIEILADLKKKPEKNNTNEQWVSKLAEKLTPMDSKVNIDYKTLQIGSLLGYPVEMCLMPMQAGKAKKVPLENGEFGIIFDEPPEMAALRSWRSQKYSQAEKAMAARWRAYIESIDLDVFTLPGKLTGIENLQELRNLTRLVLTNRKENQLISVYRSLMGKNVSEPVRRKIRERWHRSKIPFFLDFAPYAFHCFEVEVVFRTGLIHGLVPKRKTNQIDLEYLYYFPFCMIFCSNDKFHKTIAPTFLSDNQTFLTGENLKKDLKILADEFDSLTPDQKKDRGYDYGSYPPPIETSLTHQLWKKYMRPWKPGSGNKLLKMTPEEKEKLMKEMKPIIESLKKAEGKS